MMSAVRSVSRLCRAVLGPILVALAAALPLAAQSPPPNDNFANRIAIPGPGTVTGTNVGATRQTNDPVHHNNTVWWSFTPSADGWFVIDTTGTGFAHYLGTYRGTSLGALTLIDSASRNSATPIVLEFEARAGVPIQILVAGVSGATGQISLTTQLFTNRGATTIQLTGPTGPTARRASASFQAQVRTSAGTIGAQITWLANGEEFGTDRAGTDGYRSRSTSDLPVGANRITVHYAGNRTTRSSTSEVLIHTVAGPPAQPNDDFAQATRINAPGTVTGSSVGATYEIGEPMILDRRRHYTVWWVFRPAASGQLTIDTLGSGFDTVLAVYTGNALNALTLVAANDDIPGTSSRSRVSFQASAGVDYRIVVSSGWLGSYNGAITLNLGLTPGGGAPTTTSISGNVEGVAGGNLAFHATVAGPDQVRPTGQVSFRRGTVEFGRATLNASGTASLVTSALPAGTHQVTAHYLGAAGFQPSTSRAMTVVIHGSVSATTSVLSGPTTGQVGQDLTYRVRVTSPGGTPTGTVYLMRNGADFASRPLNPPQQGVIDFTAVRLSAGTQQISARFVGSAAFGNSTANTLSVVIGPTGPAATTTTLSGPTSGQQGQSLTFVAQVSPTAGGGTPTGTVSFRRGGTQFATASLSGGSASVTTSALPVGTHQITAQFQGTAAFATSTSAARTVTIVAVAVDPVQFFGGGSVFGFSDACRPAWSRVSEAVRARYSPSELNGGPPSELAIVWPTGSEHVSLWGNMLPSEQFRGGTGRQMWSYFVFYPLRPLVRVVQRQVTQPLNASLANAQELVLRLRVQNFGAIPGCTAVVAVTLRRAG